MIFFNMRKIQPGENLAGWDPTGSIVRGYVKEEIQGFYGLRVQAGSTVWVQKFYVLPKYRKLGIGTVLHLDMLALVKLTSVKQPNVKAIFMYVNECNRHLEWLKKFHWEAIGVARAYYGTRDAYIMRIKL